MVFFETVHSNIFDSVLLNSILLSGTHIIPNVSMKRTFIEAKDFKKKVDSLGDKNLLLIIQNAILNNPE